MPSTATILRMVVMGGLSVIGALESRKRSMTKYDMSITKPVDTVSIIVPSYNETLFIEQCLNSLANQSIIRKYPEYFEILVVDSGSTDGTIQQVLDFIGNRNVNGLDGYNISGLDNGSFNNIRLIMAPRGKLTARNLGTDIAKGNIIVSTDADMFCPDSWLANLLYSFQSDKVQHKNIVGTFGHTIYSPMILTSLTEVDNIFFHKNRMVGNNCAYYKYAFYTVGEFDDSIDQSVWSKVNKEEEIDFGNRLSNMGHIIYNNGAVAYHLGEDKFYCRIRGDCNNSQGMSKLSSLYANR